MSAADGRIRNGRISQHRGKVPLTAKSAGRCAGCAFFNRTVLHPVVGRCAVDSVPVFTFSTCDLFRTFERDIRASMSEAA